MSTKNLVTLAAVVACVFLGGLAIHRSGPDGPAPAPEPKLVCESWQETLAGHIPDRIATGDALTLVVLEMHDAGDITDDDLRAVQTAIPDLASRDRPLTADDAAKLRALVAPVQPVTPKTP